MKCIDVLAYTASVVDMRLLGLVFRRARDGKNWTQDELSEVTKRPDVPAISVTTISDFEGGKTNDPGLQTVARLADALGLNLQTVFSPVSPRKAESDRRSLSPITITPQIADAIEVLALAALAAVDREIPDRSSTGDRAEDPSAGEDSAASGGQDPSDV